MGLMKKISYMAKLELARRNFFDYANLKHGDFYKTDRKYLKSLCEQMQSFYEHDDKKVLILNIPPR